MTIQEFANVLGVSVSEIIKRLMGLGIMMTINNAIDFDTAEILALDYKKVLKKDSTRDEINFEDLSNEE